MPRRRPRPFVPSACVVRFRDVGRWPRQSWSATMTPRAGDIVAAARRRARLPDGPVRAEYDWRINEGVLLVRDIVVGRFSLKPLEGDRR